jgi:plasmid stability protein
MNEKIKDRDIMEIKIRNVDPVLVNKINIAAKKHKLSREAYLRKMLTQIILIDNNEIEDKYVNLVNILSERLEQANDIIEKNTYVIEKMMDIQQ